MRGADASRLRSAPLSRPTVSLLQSSLFKSAKDSIFADQGFDFLRTKDSILRDPRIRLAEPKDWILPGPQKSNPWTDPSIESLPNPLAGKVNSLAGHLTIRSARFKRMLLFFHRPGRGRFPGTCARNPKRVFTPTAGLLVVELHPTSRRRIRSLEMILRDAALLRMLACAPGKQRNRFAWR
jgi:hypothetical protein